jgi:hypothetical protein
MATPEDGAQPPPEPEEQRAGKPRWLAPLLLLLSLLVLVVLCIGLSVWGP